MLEVHHLLHVLALADHRSFSRAAEAVHLTQPALTRSIQVAERRLGARLFDRSRSGVEPTALGRLVIERARSVVEGIRDLEHEVAVHKGLVSGSLAVSLAPYPGALSGQHAIAHLLAEHPGISCRVRAGDWARATQDVLDGNVDLSIADLGEAAGDPRLSVEPLNNCQCWFVCGPGHPLLGRRGLSIDDLATFPWAGTRVPARMRAFLPAAGGRCGQWDARSGAFVPSIQTDVMSEFSVLARESDALVVCTLSMVAAELEAGRVVVLPFSAPWLRLNYGVIVRRGRTLPPIAEEFIRIIREIEAELEEREEKLSVRFAGRRS